MSRIVALTLVLAFAVAGCGDPEKDYCGALEKDRVKIADMLDGGPGALVTHLSLLKDLRDQAPPDLTDEWQTFVNAVDGLADQLKEAGVKPGDYEAGKPPAGLDAAAARAIAEAANQLASEQAVAAAAGIEQQARDVCKFNLGL